jgi:hypothetical protein
MYIDDETADEDKPWEQSSQFLIKPSAWAPPAGPHFKSKDTSNDWKGPTNNDGDDDGA